MFTIERTIKWKIESGKWEIKGRCAPFCCPGNCAPQRGMRGTINPIRTRANKAGGNTDPSARIAQREHAPEARRRMEVGVK